MREIFKYGSVGGAPGNRCFYLELDRHFAAPFGLAPCRQVTLCVEPVEKVNISFLSSKPYLKFTLICGIE